MKIYMIRHGKTLANEQSLYCGSTDLHLSAQGIAELKNYHYDVQNVRFITSGMHRTNETLKVIFGDVDFEEDPRFREMDFGMFEMKNSRQMKDDPDYSAWLTGEFERNVPPCGESIQQMRVRVMEALAQIQEDTFIVAHGGVISAAMQALFPEEGKGFYQWEPRNGCGYCITDDQYRAFP